MPNTLRCRVCGEDKPADEVLIAPERFDTNVSDETEKWTGPICKDCREKMKEGK